MKSRLNALKWSSPILSHQERNHQSDICVFRKTENHLFAITMKSGNNDIHHLDGFFIAESDKYHITIKTECKTSS